MFHPKTKISKFHLVNNITNNLDSSNIVIGVFLLDLKMIFDTVDHTII